MKKPLPDDRWPESWKLSYAYDLQEVFGQTSSYGYTRAYENRRRQTLELIKRSAAPPARVLDVAAAQGNFSLTLAEAGYVVTWNDIRGDLVDYVRLKHEEGQIDFAPGNAFELGLEGRFDVVVITEVIEHVAHPDDFLKKVGSLVRPGGHVIMTTPNGEYFRNRLPKFSETADPSQFEAVQFKPNSDGHIFLLHRDELAGFAATAGLEIVETRLFNNSLTSGHLKSERLARLLPERWVRAIDDLTTRLPDRLSRRLHTSMAVRFHRPPVDLRSP